MTMNLLTRLREGSGINDDAKSVARTLQLLDRDLFDDDVLYRFGKKN